MGAQVGVTAPSDEMCERIGSVIAHFVTPHVYEDEDSGNQQLLDFITQALGDKDIGRAQELIRELSYEVAEAAVAPYAELIAADREYDEANAAYAELTRWIVSSAAIPSDYQESSKEAVERCNRATARRASALAALSSPNATGGV